MVPGDRPGPSVQMITNFMFPNKNGNVDYSSTANVNPEPPVSVVLLKKVLEGTSGCPKMRELFILSTNVPCFVLLGTILTIQIYTKQNF